MMRGWHHHDASWSAWPLMGILCLVLVALAIFLFVRLMSGGGRLGGGGRETPEEILDRRFAQGELDAETYRAQRAVLSEVRGKKRTGSS